MGVLPVALEGPEGLLGRLPLQVHRDLVVSVHQPAQEHVDMGKGQCDGIRRVQIIVSGYGFFYSDESQPSCVSSLAFKMKLK